MRYNKKSIVQWWKDETWGWTFNGRSMCQKTWKLWHWTQVPLLTVLLLFCRCSSCDSKFLSFFADQAERKNLRYFFALFLSKIYDTEIFICLRAKIIMRISLFHQQCKRRENLLRLCRRMLKETKRDIGTKGQQIWQTLMFQVHKKSFYHNALELLALRSLSLALKQLCI